MATSSFVKFGPNDRTGALRYAARHALDKRLIHVLFYEYVQNSWCVCEYYEFALLREGHVCYEDLRYVLPFGEVTRLS
jgi:hypothetical protein